MNPHLRRPRRTGALVPVAPWLAAGGLALLTVLPVLSACGREAAVLRDEALVAETAAPIPACEESAHGEGYCPLDALAPR